MKPLGTNGQPIALTPDGDLPFELQEVVERAAHIPVSISSDSLQVDSPAHRALFTPQGWVFTPKMDGQLKPELSFSYRLRSITTGNRVLYQQGESSPSPTASENRISYYRGEGITERYIATSQGIEQQFLLEKPLKMERDFIVRGKITTDLLPNTSDSTKGIEFQSWGRTIIIGSPTYMGNIQMKDFLEQHWEILKHKNIYLYTVGMFPWESPESKKSF